jgi:enoyl-CoA hydratase/carnithine racemase
VDAAEALEWGLVNRLVDPADGDVVDAAIELAHTVAANPAFGVRLTKEMLRTTGTAASLREAVLLENRTQVLAVYAGDIDHATAGFRSDSALRGR